VAHQSRIRQLKSIGMKVAASCTPHINPHCPGLLVVLLAIDASFASWQSPGGDWKFMKISGDCWHATQRVAIDSTWYIGVIVHKLRCLQHLIHHLPECQEDGHLTALILSTSQKKGNIIKKLNSWQVQCKYCPDMSPTIEHQDSKCLEHLVKF
jgi:hypothetical protein